MTKKEKLWKKAQENPQNITFNEFETLLRQTGWIFSRQKGSHCLWYSPNVNHYQFNRAKTVKLKFIKFNNLLNISRKKNNVFRKL